MVEGEGVTGQRCELDIYGCFVNDEMCTLREGEGEGGRVVRDVFRHELCAGKVQRSSTLEPAGTSSLHTEHVQNSKCSVRMHCSTNKDTRRTRKLAQVGKVLPAKN